MKHKYPLAMAWAGMAAALVWSPALPAQAAETDECLVAIFACNSQGEAFAVANGFMLDIGGSTVVFSFGMDSWEDAATCVAIDTSGNSFELILSGLDTNAATATFNTVDYMGGFPINSAVSFSSLYEGETVYCGGLDLMSDAENVADMAVMIENTVAGTVEMNGYTFVQLTDAIDSTYSGGPVFTGEGNLVGIQAATQSGGGVFLPMDYFIEFTESSGDDHGDGETSGQGGVSESENSGNGSTGSGGSGTGGGDGSGSGDGSGGGSGGSGYTSDGITSAASPVFGTVFLVLFGTALVAFIASMLACMNRDMRRRAAGLPEFDLMPVLGGGSSQEEGVFTVMGKGGYFNGKSCSLAKGPVIMGRDASRCSWVYPSDTRGISGLHCKLEQTAQGVILTDLGSTYGTFLKDGRRIPANIPCQLKRGDEFYLAEPANTYQII